MIKQLNTSRVLRSPAGVFVFLVWVQMGAVAQVASEAGEARTQIIEPETNNIKASEYVSINVKDANIAEVLKAYSLQTGQSIVVGPDVVSDSVNVRLNNIPWEEALDVILKPYGFGYRVVGDTIVISKLENIVTVEGIEPLVSEVFRLGYRDAYDIQAIIEAQLSARGKYTILETKSLPGWEFGGEGSSSGAATEGGVRQRRVREEIRKSKTIVVTDVPSAITKIEKIIKKIDVMPEQVLIEAKFLEISKGAGSDIGLDYVQGLENVDDSLQSSGSSLQPQSVNSDVLKVLNSVSGYPNPLNTAAAGGYGMDEGLRLSHALIGDWGAEMLFKFIAQDDDSNILSAPRVLTLNNQEAAILVGEKFPIIESQNNTGSGSSITSTSLDYYENIGIQLNVIPQVCADEYVNMIVHPAVSQIQGYESGLVTAGSDVQSGTRYPILDIREAETQIMIKSDQTAIIGGLQEERDKEIIKKIPILGDIPFLGRLFRRETLSKEKIDLLIFIKASVVDTESYQMDSAAAHARRVKLMELDLLQPDVADKAVSNPAETAASVRDSAQILALVQDKNSTMTTNAPTTK
ncbi:secretin and TonB N-terminal domain-containing protein [Pontiella agarivorans]|uniref:Secretin and TonB N-terminal domain-containing protein n=1 Tax=Pontiella agarivorans TaxID=3038953 RepID=A0ABU5MYK7_9BACT|nr:secretin and TonB N-terminal domain-containing protein [Pontiella agarivorans]MDZ8119277.1 secretin and TonB N-terminal domain-containing protein [Pontiella agarivorans]